MSSPPSDTAPPSGFDTATLWSIPRVGSPVASDDGTVVLVPVTTHEDDGTTTRLWLLQPDGDPLAVSPADVSCSRPAVSPDGARIAWVQTVDDEPQVAVATAAGDDVRVVTAVPGGVVGSPRFVDRSRLLVVATLWADDPSPAATRAWHARLDAGPAIHATEHRVGRFWDTWHEDDATQHVLLVDVDDPDVDPVDLTPGHWLLPDPLSDPGHHAAVSPDGSLLAFTTATPEGDEDGIPLAHLRVVPVGGGDVVDLTPDVPGPVGPPSWLPDGRVVVTISHDRDFYAAPRDLWAIDPLTGDRDLLLGGADHGLDVVTVAADGRIVIGTELRGRTRLVEVVDGTTVPLGDHTGPGLAAPVATTRGTFATTSTITAPPEVAFVDADGTRLLTGFARPAVANLDLGTLEERTITGADGDDVQVLVLHPPAAASPDTDGPPPLVHLVHGGPHGVFGDEWHWRWSAARFAAEGWVVAMVNFHGSTGFGHAFTSSIHGDWPTKPTEDVLRATDALVADGTVDPDRMAIAGGSYGGYLVTWLCTVTDRFAAAVAHAAVTDLSGMLASDWSATAAFGGLPWDDPDVLARSPSSRYGRLATPTLVLHGIRDLRVPIDQGRALYGALQHRRVPSRLVVFPDEHHWVVDRAASERWYAEVLDWLHRFLDR